MILLFFFRSGPGKGLRSPRSLIKDSLEPLIKAPCETLIQGPLSRFLYQGLLIQGPCKACFFFVRFKTLYICSIKIDDSQFLYDFV